MEENPVQSAPSNPTGHQNTLSIESQKGVNADQRYSVENQMGAIAVQSIWR